MFESDVPEEFDDYLYGNDGMLDVDALRGALVVWALMSALSRGLWRRTYFRWTR